MDELRLNLRAKGRPKRLNRFDQRTSAGSVEVQWLWRWLAGAINHHCHTHGPIANSDRCHLGNVLAILPFAPLHVSLLLLGQQFATAEWHEL